MNRDFITECQADWSRGNLLGLATCLRSANAIISELSSSNPCFHTPNRRWFEGIGRWMAVDHALDQGCKIGLLTGITSTWRFLGEGEGGIAALELRGQFTTLIAHHLKEADDPQRDSRLRFEKRLNNQKYYAADLWETPKRETPETNDLSPLNLTLDHGDKNNEFAFLRAYDSADNLNSRIDVIGCNIMALEQQMTKHESEEVHEAEILLKVHLASLKKDLPKAG